MTTQSRDYAPVMDRLIVRTIPAESPGLNPLGQPLPGGIPRFSRYGRPGAIIEGVTS